MELHKGDIIQLHLSDYTVPDRYLIVQDSKNFNLSNKSHFISWDTCERCHVKVTVFNYSVLQDKLFLLKPEFEEVKYIGFYLTNTARIKPEDKFNIWHSISVRHAKDNI